MASLPSWSAWQLWPCYSCCTQLWVPSLATFGDSCLGIVAHVPATVAVLVLLCRYAFLPLWWRRPEWLRDFAAEEKDLTADLDADLFTKRPRPWRRHAVALMAVSVASIACSIVLSYALDFGPLFLIPLIPSAISCIILGIDRPRSTPAPVLLLHLVVLVVQLTLLLAVPELLAWPFNLAWAVEVVAPVSSLAIVLAMPLRDPLMGDQDIGMPFQTPSYSKRSPEDNFSLWHWMTVSWMGPLISMARQRQLHDEDVWLLPYQFQHDRLHRLFREVKGSVTMRILKANAPDLFITSALGIVESVTSLLPIVLLKQLLTALEGDTPNVRVAVVYAIFTLVTTLVRAQSGVFTLWFSRRCYERSRGEMITMIYEKTLRRKAFTIPSSHTPQASETNGRDDVGSNSKPANGNGGTRKAAEAEDETKAAKGPASMGKILNLMRNDVYEVAQRFWEFPNLLTRPLNFVLCVVLLWNILGAASLLGILVLILAQSANYWVIRAWVRWETKRRAVTDMKLQVTSQFIEAIRHLRWYDWQDKWLGRILTQRQRELRLRVITNLFSKGVEALNQMAAVFFPVAAFYAYTVVGKQPLTVDVAFPALNLFNMLETSLRELPNLVTVLLNAAVAMGRIEGFMAEPDKEDGHGEDSVSPPPAAAEDVRIVLRDASFAWPGQNSSSCILHNINLTCVPGLVLVCGKVGNGKTALLQAILGEMDQHGGERLVPDELVGYCAQTPWLQSMSIRDNILFCENFDAVRYRQVLDACCLVPDLREFKAGDLSMIGENGVGLSGGQKARVALARAVYSRSRVLLLDDPIAALDHNTAETIIMRLFSTTSLMRNRLAVLVTHRVDMVREYARQVVEVRDDGTISFPNPDELVCDQGEDEDQDLPLQRPKIATQDDGQEGAIASFDGANDAVPEKFIEEERRVHGGVVASVYWRYIRAGKLKWWGCIVAASVLFRISKLSYFYFLKIWGEAYEHTTSSSPSRGLVLLSLQTAADGYAAQGQPSTAAAAMAAAGDWFDGINLGLPPPDENVRPWLFWFAVFALGQLVTRVFADIVLIVLTYTAGKKMFEDVMHRVANATFRFFDTTPVGRLMNRVTSDMGTVDGQIAAQIFSCGWNGLNWAFAIGVIASTAPLFLVLALCTTAIFFAVFLHFLPASQSLRRLEMVSLSPLMSNFGTLVEGLTTVRAFRAQRHFQLRNITTTDAFQKMDHFYWSLQAWLQYRFDALSALSTFALTLTALWTGLSSGTVAFLLATAALFVNSTHVLCKKYGELQMQFVSVERVIELLDLEQEDEGDTNPPAAWPTSNDVISFEDVTIRYAPHLEPSLRNITLRIPPGSTVAVTGRTGSGKSTLALALLGTVPADAAGPASGIWIGNMNVASVNKHALRSRISFVAQEPVLFPGTLRENLDPTGEHSDDECAQVLERVMRDAGDFTIRSRVDGGGKNLSQGQRQLVGLGRAVLRRSQIVILDEATASIDVETAFYIQEVLREELRHSTVITIAHRLEAVKDADYSVILDNGSVVYAGPPQTVQPQRY